MMDTKKYITKLFKKKPTIQQLRDSLSKLSENIDKVNTISTHYVDFDFFRVQCD